MVLSWFGNRSTGVRVDGLELRVSALEAKIASASEVLEATERLDRIIKRSFRLNRQLDLLEGKSSANNADEQHLHITRASLLRGSQR